MRPGLPTTGPHVFVPDLDGEVLNVEGDEAHHLHTVLRIRTGDLLSLADATGAVAQVVVTGVDRRRVRVEVTDRHDVPAVTPSVCVVQALPKGRKMEEVVQRLTELGVDRLRPTVTARTVKQVADKADRVARWEAVALAAARQSRRARPLRIDPIAPWPVSDAVGAVLYELADVPLAQALEPLLTPHADAPPEITLAIGPEGGFEEAEVEQSGLAPAALGATILRTETAGVVAASVLLHRLGRLG
ncbi:16S rRNA (uracil(1498)-N(3))-methyltransferase [soil metagenome]